MNLYKEFPLSVLLPASVSFSLSLTTALVLLPLPISAQEDMQETRQEGAQNEEQSSLNAGKPPNFLVIVADDMGWSDVGAFGGEIRTPTLNALAAAGTSMTDYYVAPTCSPTRSMLLTGVDNHLAGVGTMHGIAAPNQNTHNYEGQLHNDVVTVAEVLGAHGYQTMHTGKWHLGLDEAQRADNRGFQRTFGLAGGGASHFSDRQMLSPQENVTYLEDGKPAELADDFYSSIGYTDKMLEYLKGKDATAPFFAYLAYTAPHDPLQVPDNWLYKYKGAYAKGPLATRQARTEKAKSLGLIDKDAALWQMPDFPSWFPTYNAPWDERSEELQLSDARPMEVYAAMIELMDQQIGRVIDHLKSTDELGNTYVIFFSDNGASAASPLVYSGSSIEWLLDNWSIDPANYGTKGSYTVMGGEWASTSNSPFRLFKAQVAEGGIRSPLIVKGPSIPAGTYNKALAHVSDIVPTLLDIAGINSQTDAMYEGKIKPQGSSLMPVWTQQASKVRDWFGTELLGNRGLRHGNMKISWITKPLGNGTWELYDLAKDPGEVNDLAAEKPELLADMISLYDEYVRSNDVIFPEPPVRLSLRRIYNKPCNWWCEFRFKVIGVLPAS